MTLAKCCSRFHKKSFADLAAKINAMLKVYEALHGAAPSSVTPAIALVGSQYQSSVREHLQAFYRASGVNVVVKGATARDEPGEKDMEPVHRDMKLAHQVLLDSTMLLADAMEACAKGKLTQAFSERESRFVHQHQSRTQYRSSVAGGSRVSGS